MVFLFNGGALKSIYEQHVLKSYLIDNIKIVDTSKAFDEGVLKNKYAQGWSLRKISRELGISRSLARRKIF